MGTPASRAFLLSRVSHELVLSWCREQVYRFWSGNTTLTTRSTRLSERTTSWTSSLWWSTPTPRFVATWARQLLQVWLGYSRNSPSAVALAFEEMRTPYASGREIFVQKFGNAYRRNSETIKWCFSKAPLSPSNDSSQRNIGTMPAFLSQYLIACLPWSSVSCVVWEVSRLNPGFCVRCTHLFHDFAYS